ncbi:MAG: proline-rich domain-containing protein [Minisyncoccales bacterium]
MKKEVIFSSLFLIVLVFFLPLVLTEENSTESDAPVDEDEKIDNAYDCLEEKVDAKTCSDMNTEEKIFALLSIGECEDELIEESNDRKCWPASRCNIKTTAQAVFAIDKRGSEDIEEAKEWLLSKEIFPSDLEWFLQIESSKKTKCTIEYKGASFKINIDEDKKIDSNAGSCLQLSQGDYWLKISGNCYDDAFTITCDKDFLSNIFFKRKDSSVIHVLDKTSFGSPNSSTIEEINSSCFSTSGNCNYESTLWAALALETAEQPTKRYLSYLIAMKEENEELLPEVFLYFLTGAYDFRNDLLLKQKENKYWDESGDKIYDTSLALFPFQYESSTEKANAKEWLLETQDENGCWKDNIKTTSQALYFIWPRDFSSDSGDGGEPTYLNCTNAGYFCRPSIDCVEDEGNILNEYECSGSYKCCDTEKEETTCSEQGGEICNSEQSCIGGRNDSDYDELGSGEVCCIGGSCQEKTQEDYDCEPSGGVCRTSCQDDEEEDSFYTCAYGENCCFEKPESPEPEKNYLWLWILLGILVVLIILGIIFREKLKPYWYKLLSKFQKRKSSSSGRGPPGPRRGPPGYPPGPGFSGPRRGPPGYPQRPMPSGQKRPPIGSPGNPSTKPPASPKTPSQRKILPPGESSKTPQQKSPKIPLKKESRKELDDVLKKLKDMGK